MTVRKMLHKDRLDCLEEMYRTATPSYRHYLSGRLAQIDLCLAYLDQRSEKARPPEAAFPAGGKPEPSA